MSEKCVCMFSFQRFFLPFLCWRFVFSPWNFWISAARFSLFLWALSFSCHFSLSLSFGYFFPQRFQHTFISSNGLYQQQWQRFHSSSSQHFTHKQHSYFTHISIFQQNLNDEISFFCCFMICVCVCVVSAWRCCCCCETMKNVALWYNVTIDYYNRILFFKKILFK